jgi:hypothetical protein
MRIALIHATTTAIIPIDSALRKLNPNVNIFHFMDTGLLEMLQLDGTLSERITERFQRLIQQAVDTQVDCIQLTCSAFNNLVEIFQPIYSIKMFRSDEAMLDAALGYQTIGLVATVRETPIALSHYLHQKNPVIQVRSLATPKAMDLLIRGRKDQHDQLIRDMVTQLEPVVDVILLSQYSMEHVKDQLSIQIPVLTGSELAAQRCLSYCARGV